MKAYEATAHALNCAVLGLTNGSSYTFRVSAVQISLKEYDRSTAMKMDDRSQYS